MIRRRAVPLFTEHERRLNLHMPKILNLSRFISLFVIIGLVGGASAATTITETFTKNAGVTIPDNNSSGLVSTQTISANIGSIDVIVLTLKTDGGWNGDLYAYLQHSTGFSILLNRTGRTAAVPAGSGSSGFDVVFKDSAVNDVHSASGSGTVSGEWQPDARTADPGLVFDTSPRSSFLSSFNGLNPSGTWTLFVADLATGDTATLNSWSLSVTGEMIPEPGSLLLFAVGIAGVVLRRRR